MTSRAPIAGPIQMPASSPAEPQQRAGDMRARAALPPAAANRRRVLAALLAVAWCAALAWLALATSNPVILNRAQIRGADAVVTVRIEDRASGKCRVVQQWSGDAVPAELVVRELAKTAARGDGEWILPLQKTREGYEVQQSALSSQARLVYPATKEAVGQIREILGF